jgi:fibronectin-binding autotransporter adhesin
MAGMAMRLSLPKVVRPLVPRVGLIAINNMPNSNQTVVRAEAGIDGGLGGIIELNVTPSSLDQVQFQLLGNGTMDLSGLRQNAVTIGSLSGQGTVILSRFILNIGSNNLSTTFSGIIQNNGAITKIGTGSLSLTGASSYRRGTTVTVALCLWPTTALLLPAEAP